MSAHDLALELPKPGSAEFTKLYQRLFDAAGWGDLARLQQLGVAAVAHIGGGNLVNTALRHGQAHVLAWLVEESERREIDIAKRWKSTHVAALQGHMDTLRAASDEELLQRTEDSETALHAAAIGDQAEAIEYLVCERGLHVEMPARLNSSPLEIASQYGSLSAIEALVACGARLHDGEPPKALMAAAGAEQVAAMEKLVGLGADITGVGVWGSVVHAAAASGCEEAIVRAVELGADPRAVDGCGGTALHTAAFHDKAGLLRGLVRLGLDVDATNDEGRTALHCAHTALRACRKLLELGADRWIKEKRGHTPREIADLSWKRDKAQPVVELLDTYWPIVPCMAQLLLGLRGPSESALTRFAVHSAFEPKVLSLVNCLLTGKDDKAFEQLVEEC